MFTKKSFVWLLSLTVLISLLLAACGPAATATPAAAPATQAPAATSAPANTVAPATQAAPAATTAAPAGSVLRWSLEGINELPAMDPPLAGASQSVGVISLVFEGLVRLDSNLKIAPAGAESWDIKDGGKTFIFHIRKGLKFANGDPVTADDFAYSLNRAFGPDFANGNAGYYLSNIVGSTDVTNAKAKTISGV